MPLRDYFHPPIEFRLPWPSLHSGWVAELTGRLNELMPPGFVALDELRIDGGLEIDVAAIRIYMDKGERHLVGAIELVSPGNKDRDEAREVFVGKCLDYLAGGASLVIVDVVTNRHANLHNQLARRIGAPPTVELPDDTLVYATAYRPVKRDKRSQIDMWVRPVAVGDLLPTMPLRLIADEFVPVELEWTYTEACRRRKLA